MRVTIHQPNFFPYSGILEKAATSDVFVVLAHAQFSRGNYHNRFEYGGRWLTMGVSQALEPLISKVYSRPVQDWDQIKRRLPDRNRTLSEFDDCICESLVNTNVCIIQRLFERLKIGASVVLDYATPLTGTDRLVDLCNFYGATVYVSGPSGRSYLEQDKFMSRGMAVEFFVPKPPPVPAIDLLETA